jgi:hypothetical protein
LSLVVVCRSAKEPLSSPEWKLGYNCSVCNHPLQVGPGGRSAIAAGAKPFCTPFGLDFAKSLKPEELAGTMWTPEALKNLQRRIANARNSENN